MKDKIILVVEDDIVSCELFKELFERKNIESYIIVHNGEKAIEVCRTVEGVQLVLMDYKLPGMDGCEALKEIRKINKDIRIVMQTAYAYNLKKELVKDCDIDDYITKPIISDKLYSILNKYWINNSN
jgi:two-component system cell cycle response regulator DivK